MYQKKKFRKSVDRINAGKRQSSGVDGSSGSGSDQRSRTIHFDTGWEAEFLVWHTILR
jgi:hypothetical protein